MKYRSSYNDRHCAVNIQLSSMYLIKSFNVPTTNMLVIFIATHPKRSTECFVRRQALGTMPSPNRGQQAITRHVTVPTVN